METTIKNAAQVSPPLPELLALVGAKEFKVQAKGGLYHFYPAEDGKVSGTITSKPRGKKSEPTATWANLVSAERDMSRFGGKVELTTEQKTALRNGKPITLNGVALAYAPAINAKEPFIVSNRPSKVGTENVVKTFTGTTDEVQGLLFDVYR